MQSMRMMSHRHDYTHLMLKHYFLRLVPIVVDTQDVFLSCLGLNVLHNIVHSASSRLGWKQVLPIEKETKGLLPQLLFNVVMSR